jgi:diaminohydroxyphosphoribosylaminopyrimidine deaminase/5-amino-6-(5-phosphoribosylamino)uracil reductase
VSGSKRERTDAVFMAECLRLAAKGRGRVSPNPLVGAVVVRRGRIIGKGYHRRFGGPHAELEAIGSCRASTTGATLYVNLEPCCHVGKTPPCTGLIISSRIARVVVGMTDPNPLVSGKGLAALRRAGIRVETGVLEGECSRLNAAFARHVTTGMPLVTLKIAQTTDGVVADRNGAGRWITGEASRADAHARRSASDCVLVGAGTVRRDNPRLTVRRAPGPQPVRAVLDGRFTVTTGANVFAGIRSSPTVLITSEGAFARHRRKAKTLARKGVVFLVFPGRRGGYIPPGEILHALGARGFTSVLVEGGPRVWGSFVNERCADRLVLYTAPSLLGGDRLAFGRLRPSTLERRLRLSDVSVRRLGEDVLTEAEILYTPRME